MHAHGVLKSKRRTRAIGLDRRTDKDSYLWKFLLLKFEIIEFEITDVEERL